MVFKSFQSPVASSEVRFGEFLLERKLISDEQWLASLADHWSHRGRRLGASIVANGFLASAVIESQARVFHEDASTDFDVDLCEEIEELNALLSVWSFERAPASTGDFAPSSKPSPLNSTSSAAKPPNSPHHAWLARAPLPTVRLLAPSWAAQSDEAEVDEPDFG